MLKLRFHFLIALFLILLETSLYLLINLGTHYVSQFFQVCFYVSQCKCYNSLCTFFLLKQFSGIFHVCYCKWDPFFLFYLLFLEQERIHFCIFLFNAAYLLGLLFNYKQSLPNLSACQNHLWIFKNSQAQATPQTK